MCMVYCNLLVYIVGWVKGEVMVDYGIKFLLDYYKDSIYGGYFWLVDCGMV